SRAETAGAPGSRTARRAGGRRRRTTARARFRAPQRLSGPCCLTTADRCGTSARPAWPYDTGAPTRRKPSIAPAPDPSPGVQYVGNSRARAGARAGFSGAAAQAWIVGRVGDGEGALGERAGRAGHPCEALAERLALQVARVDAFADDGELIERQHLVE